jgi:hypothetical protein
MRRERLRRDVHERRPRSDRRNRQKRVNARPQQRHAQEDSGIAKLDLLEQSAALLYQAFTGHPDPNI